MHPVLTFGEGFNARYDRNGGIIARFGLVQLVTEVDAVATSLSDDEDFQVVEDHSGG